MPNNPAGIRVYAYIEETKPDGERVLHGQVLLADSIPSVEVADKYIDAIVQVAR